MMRRPRHERIAPAHRDRPGDLRIQAAGLDWQEGAPCAEVGEPLFFPEDYQQAVNSATYDAPKRVCGGCPVTAECLEFALKMEARPEHLGRHGVWGGLSPPEREAIARKRRAA